MLRQTNMIRHDDDGDASDDDVYEDDYGCDDHDDDDDSHGGAIVVMTAKKGNNTLCKIGVHTKLLSTPSANGHWQEVTQQVFGENTICLDIGTRKK